MGVRDALLHNTTGSNFEALQSGDTARIKGDFSIKNTSDVEIFGVDVSAATVNVAGNITSTMNVSGSGTSTGSFGRFVASTYQGDGKAIRDTLTRSSGLITASAQIASDISGAFDSGFFFGFEASSSISGGLGITGSFGRLQGEEFFGSGVGLQSTLPRSPGLVTGSAQLASRISGSFNKGFEFTGTIVGDTSVCSHNSLPGVTSIGASMATGQSRMLGIGLSPNAAIAISSGDAENYDGTAWSEAIASTPFNNANVHSEFGTQNDAAFLCNGYVAITTVWDGTAPASFTNNAHQANNTDGVSSAGAGLSSNAGIKLDPNGKTECYNGSAWTELNTMPGDATTEFGMSGDTEAALKTGGAGNSTNGTQIWNGTNWSEGASLSVATTYARNQGSVNASLYSGGYSADRPGGNCSQEEYNGTSWAAGGNLVLGVSHHQSLGKNSGGPGGLTFGGESGYDAPAPAADPGGVGGPSFEGATASGRLLQIYEREMTATGSFGRLVATTFHGDGGGLQSTLPRAAGTVTGSAQLASRISGSFTSGFAFTTTSSLGSSSGSLISASAGGTANLTVDRVKANHLTGDGSNLVSLIAPGLVSSSAQLASRISGSFNKGFGFGMTTQQILDGTFVGVSGSTFANAGNATTMSINSLCGSDFDYRLANTVGKITGKNVGAGNWSNGPDMITAVNGRGMAGTQNAFLSMGGYVDPNKTVTQKYNGNSWSLSAALITGGRATAGVGTQNAAGLFGGYDHGYNGTEFYNGAAWSEGPTFDAGTAGWKGSAGTQNAALIYGGIGPGNAKRANTELYNGNVFTEAANLNTGRGLTSAGGTQNDAIYAGGLDGPGTANTEIWNGSSWTEVNNMITARWNSTGIGTANHFLVVAGHAGGAICAETEEWNGTSWSEATHLTTGRSYAGPAAGGLGSQGIYTGGDYSPATKANTEFWDDNSTTGSFGRVDSDNFVGDGSQLTNIPIPTGLVTGSGQLAAQISGAFTSGFEVNGALTALQITTASYVGVSGSAFGYAGNATTMSISSICGSDFDYRLYDESLKKGGITGTSFGTGVWTAGTNRPVIMSSGFNIGTQNSALSVGGYAPAITAAAYKYSGDSWAASAPMILGRAAGGSAGTQNAALIFGGRVSSGDKHNDETEEYNGSSWSEQNNLPVEARNTAGTGTQNAAIQAGNYIAPATHNSETYLYNGTSWSDAGGDLNIAGRRDAGFGGTYNAAISVGGSPYPSGCTCVENWNGTSWSAGTAINTGRIGATFAGTQNIGILFGNASPYSGITEEWNGTSWTERTDLITSRGYGGCTGAGLSDAAAAFAGYGGSANVNNTEFWNATSTSTGSFGRVENATYFGDGSNIKDTLASRTAGVISGSAQIATQISGSFTSGFESTGNISGSATSTGSFGLLKPRGGGINTKAFQVTSASLFKLPVFSDRELNYQAYEDQYQTGSLSGSVDRVADVIVGQNLGEMWFDSDKNAVGYTYSSSSLISQSLDFGTFTNISASGAYQSSSQGFFTQSFYNHAVVTCYLTGSQI